MLKAGESQHKSTPTRQRCVSVALPVSLFNHEMNQFRSSYQAMDDDYLDQGLM